MLRALILVAALAAVAVAAPANAEPGYYCGEGRMGPAAPWTVADVSCRYGPGYTEACLAWVLGGCAFG